MPALTAELRKREGLGARALEFVIVTAARTNEVLGATWDEIDLASKTWTIPAHRMKSAREHRVPLSTQALKLLRSLPSEHGNPYVFVGARQPRLASNTMQAMMARSETVHGFRSSFSNWAHEQTNFSNHAIELSLAHSIGAETEKAYRRGDMFTKRARLMQAWADYGEAEMLLD